MMLEEKKKQDQTNLMNKAIGYVIRKYIYEIKKYKIDKTKLIPTTEKEYMIKDITSNDNEFHKFTFDNFPDSYVL